MLHKLTLEAALDSTQAGGLSLAFQPNAVFASSNSTLTLTVSVPIGQPSVAMTPNGGIAVAFPVTGGTGTPLVTTLAGITTTPPSSLWTITGPSSGKFIIRPANNITLMPGMSLQFIFRSLAIVAGTGTASVGIQVNGGASTPLPVTVQALVPGVIAWADPPMVGLNATSTLRWVSNGGTKVRVIGYTSNQTPGGYKDFPVGGVTNTPVNPTLDSGNPPGAHTYTVELLSEPGDQIQGSPVLVPVYLHTPYISQFGLLQPSTNLGPSLTVPYGTPVTAQWNCVFVDPNQGVTLAYGSLNPRFAPVSQTVFDPSTQLPPNGNQMVVTLSAPGWNGTTTGTVTVNYSPILVLYFKYNTWTVVEGKDVLSDAGWMTDAGSNLFGVTTDPAYPSVLKLQGTGPGGPFTQYLGTGDEPYLEIRYFSPGGAVTAGQPFTLQWFTNAATALTLTSPSGTVPVSADQIAKGTSDPLTISAATTFVLTATGASGSVSSYLTVTPA
ncbi:MAG: hypothetical protein V4726_06650 [Verrucomicrobiota bacterium]